MINKLKIDESGTVTSDGYVMSKQDLEANFLAKTPQNAKHVLTVFANMAVDKFSKNYIENYYRPTHWPGMHHKLFRFAYNNLFEQMVALSNIQGTIRADDELKQLVKTAREYPKS